MNILLNIFIVVLVLFDGSCYNYTKYTFIEQMNRGKDYENSQSNKLPRRFEESSGR